MFYYFGVEFYVDLITIYTFRHAYTYMYTGHIIDHMNFNYM